MDRLALDFVRVTEQAALSTVELIGKGDKIAADQAAVNAMRKTFATINISGEVVIGEGAKDEAPMLYTGEKVGSGGSNKLDIAVDPIEGTSLVAGGLSNALAVVAAAREGNLLKAPDMYMKKIAVGPEAKGVIDLEATPTDNLKAIAKAKGVKVSRLTVAILDRERHRNLITEVRNVGARVKLINAVDVGGGIATALDDMTTDVLMGVGGAPEGVLTAAALKCLGGDMQAQLCPVNQAEVKEALQMGIDDIDQIFKLNDLVQGEDIIFSMTGITNGEILVGVQEGQTHSLVMNSQTDQAGAIRELRTNHNQASITAQLCG
ncbi:class II fructose-bisphosphatase [Halobacteroides halobius]|nr:class II fructose-bisphosphatase [Halobacteroides halobius]